MAEPISLRSRLPLGHELLCVSRRDVALWSSACTVVLTTFIAGSSALMFWCPAEDLPGSPPPAVAVVFAPRIMMPDQLQDLAPGPQMLERPQSAPSKAAAGEAKPNPAAKPAPQEPVQEPAKEAAVAQPQVAPKLVEVKDATPISEAREPTPEAKATLKELVPDLLPAVNPEVVLPIATTPPPTKAAPAKAASAAAQAASAPAPVTTAVPLVPAERAEIAAAPKIVYARKADEISPAKWHIRVVAYLERFKTYPAKAMQRGERGTVYVRFTIDRNGRVLSTDIARSSGSAALDQAVLAMVRRASPVPPPPASLSVADLDLTAPVRFTLR